MAAHLVPDVDVDRADPQVILARADGAFHAGGAGANGVEAVEPGLGSDPVLLARLGDAVLGHVNREVLAQLVAVGLLADAAPAVGLASQASVANRASDSL